GSLNIDITSEPLGTGSNGQPVYLKDIWPSNHEVAEIVREHVNADMFRKRYSDVFKGDKHWQAITLEGGETEGGNSSSADGQSPPYFEGLPMEPKPVTDVVSARVLALFLDSITTAHVAPAGSFKSTTPAGKYL